MNQAWIWWAVSMAAIAGYVAARMEGHGRSLAVLCSVMAAVFVLALEMAVIAL